MVVAEQTVFPIDRSRLMIQHRSGDKQCLEAAIDLLNSTPVIVPWSIITCQG